MLTWFLYFVCSAVVDPDFCVLLYLHQSHNATVCAPVLWKLLQYGLFDQCIIIISFFQQRALSTKDLENSQEPFAN